MILLIDQGNSRLKWACVDEMGCICSHGVGGINESAHASLAGALNALDGGLDAVYASSVAGRASARRLSSAVRDLFGVALKFAGTAERFRELRNGYAYPSQLGVDRWMAMIGAWTIRQAGGGVLVIDAGTAMTIDGIAPDGSHLGGYIVPGYRLQCIALTQKTAAIPLPNLLAPTVSWGTSTDLAVVNGVRLGLTSLVKAALIDLQEHVADTCSVVLTGGDARLLVDAVNHNVLVDEDLLFRGLWATIAPTRCDLHRPPVRG